MGNTFGPVSEESRSKGRDNHRCRWSTLSQRGECVELNCSELTHLRNCSMQELDCCQVVKKCPSPVIPTLKVEAALCIDCTSRLCLGTNHLRVICGPLAKFKTRIESKATFALNAPSNNRRFRGIVSSPSKALPQCPLSRRFNLDFPSIPVV
jgi:hypothetical protein